MEARHKEEMETKLADIGKREPLLVNIARYFLDEQHKKETRRLHKELRKNRKAFGPRKPRFETWLRSRGLAASG
jgi:hypothetical protein